MGKVIFVHGLESGPRGRKVVFLQKHFGVDRVVCLTQPKFPFNLLFALPYTILSTRNQIRRVEALRNDGNYEVSAAVAAVDSSNSTASPAADSSKPIDAIVCSSFGALLVYYILLLRLWDSGDTPVLFMGIPTWVMFGMQYFPQHLRPSCFFLFGDQDQHSTQIQRMQLQDLYQFQVEIVPDKHPLNKHMHSIPRYLEKIKQHQMLSQPSTHSLPLQSKEQ